MKRCTKEHTVETFGVIPVGSLWADDSPYVTDDALFVDADAPQAKKTPPKTKTAAKAKES